MKYLSELLAGFFSGIAGSMGLGGGSILILYLTLFAGVDSGKAKGINLLFFIPIALISVIIYQKRKILKWKTLIPFIVFGAIGTALAVFLLQFIQPIFLKKIFGGLILCYGIYSIFSKETKKGEKKSL